MHWNRVIARHELNPELSTRAADFTEATRVLEEIVETHSAQHHDRPWGWKRPNLYMLIPFLAEVLPEMRFLLIVRDGRDMALSHNDSSVNKFGDLVLGPGEPSPLRTAKFWLVSNLWAMEQGERCLGDRFAAVRFESLVFHTAETLDQLASFSGLRPSPADMEAAAAMVRPPPDGAPEPRRKGPKIGRYRALSPEEQAALTEAVTPRLSSTRTALRASKLAVGRPQAP